MKSIWNELEKPKFEKLSGSIQTDVLVIGGGLCGLLSAAMLQDAGMDCVLVDADRILSGVTNGTTAKMTLQHGLIYHQLIEKYGADYARLYYQSQHEALERMIAMASKTDCDLKRCDSLVYSLKDEQIIENELTALRQIGCPACFCKETELPFSVAGAVKIENQASFHPLKFSYSISKNLKIYENTKVLDLQGTTAITEYGSIKAKKVIVATHFPFINHHGWYFLKMYQHRSYALALDGADPVKAMYVDEAIDGLSFRRYGNLLLLGGGSHRTGCEGGNWEELRQVAKKYYPNAREVGRWATQDCMTLDGVPYIGQYGKATPNCFVATGFNKWGMTSSMVSAMLLTDMIQGKNNEYEKIYAPRRTILHPQLAINMAESLKGLLTPKTPRCPHLGCALHYNKQEHSWDCSCHGSRFTENGRLLNNPSQKDLER